MNPSPPSHPLKSDLILLVGPGVIWGASFLFIAEGLEAMGPNAITFFRISVGFLTLAAFPQARRSVDPKLFSKILLLSIVWLAFPLSMFPYAERHVSSALTGMLNGANPLFVAAIAFLMTKEKPSRGVAIGLAVGFLGAIIMALPTVNEGKNSVFGVVLILCALASYGVALNVAGPIQQKYGVVPLIWRAQGLAILFTAPLGVPELLEAQWSLWPLLSLLALGAFGTGIAYAMLAVAAGRVGPTKASATTFLIPPVSLALGLLIRNESVAILSIVGGAICLVGAWLMRRARMKPVAESGK